MRSLIVGFRWKFLYRFIFFSCFLFPQFLFSQTFVNYSSESEARALWFTRFEYRTEASIREAIQKAKQAHFNIIFFQVRGKADAFYASSYEPWSDRYGYTYPGFDPLAVAIDEAHRNGIELHAYMNVFTMWSGAAPPQSPLHIYNTHREWVMVNSSGVPMNPAASEYAYASPAIPEYIDHLMNVFMEVVEKYDVDGIHLDRIRYPNSNYSYDSTSIARFKQETGLSSPYVDPYRWAQWRRDQVNRFVYRLYDGIMKRKPWVKLSAAVWGNYYDGFTSKLQDPRAWLKNGKIDIVAPMIYETNMGVYQSLLNNHARNSWARHVYGGIGANVFSSHPFSASEIFQQIDIARQVLAEGSVLYSATSLSQELVQSLSKGPYKDWQAAPGMSWKPVPVISHTPLTDTEDTTNPYSIIATIHSSLPLVSDSTLVIWSHSESFDDYSTSYFSQLSDSVFQAFIPPQINKNICYYLIASNQDGYVARLPQWAPTNFFSFYAGSDNIPPVISYQQNIHDSFLPIDTLKFAITVADNLKLDTNSVFVHYFSANFPIDSVQLVPDLVPDQFLGYVVPGAGVGDTLNYFFTAQDLSTSKNRAESELYSIPIGIEDFEYEIVEWTADPGWHVSNEQSQKGTYSLRFSPPAGFSGNSMSNFQTNKSLSLKRLESATLHFWTKQLLDADLVKGFVDVSIDNGEHWTSLGPPFSDYSNQWSDYYFSLAEFCGPGKPEILLRFRAQSYSDPAQEQLEWYIDDISIMSGQTPVVADHVYAVPYQLKLHQNYPNPFNSETVIQFDINPLDPVFVELKVINLKGQKVRTLLSSKLSRGQYSISWNGRDERDFPVPSGIYFYQILSPKLKTTRKMIVVR